MTDADPTRTPPAGDEPEDSTLAGSPSFPPLPFEGGGQPREDGMGEESPEGAGDAEGSASLSVDDIDREEVDQDALRVCSRLGRQGYEAYLVGGCVRDLLLGRSPKDFDVATSAHPRQIKRLFRNGRIIGRRFKLVHVVYGDNIIETATFRCEPTETGAEDEDDLLIREDNEYGTAQEDAQRRDFTINGLFMDPLKWRIHDFVGGLDDLEARVLRTIGDPRVRMAEDPVRILRAIKFATRLGFRIEPATWDAMVELAPDLERSAPPRVLLEILRLLRSGTALGAFRMLRACGALSVLLEDVDAFIGAKDDPDPAAHDRADSYWRMLEALDADIHAGREPSTALMVAVLYLRIIEREADPETRTRPGSPGDLFEVAGEVLEPVAMRTRLARRDWTRARRIIASQSRFTKASSRRNRPLEFIGSADFPEALELFRLHCAAWGQGWDQYEAWADRYERAANAPPEVLEAARRRRRRRRSRRGRRRRKPGGEGDSEDE